MEISKRLEYIKQHLDAIVGDIDQTHGECLQALLDVEDLAAAAQRMLLPNRDKAQSDRRAASKDRNAA